MKELTGGEQRIYDFIVSYWSEQGFSPSLNDIAKACYVSRTVARDYIVKLYDKGYICFVPKVARSITIKPYKR